MSSRRLDRFTATGAAVISAAIVAYGGQGLIEGPVKAGEQGWFESSLGTMPVIFVAAVLVALVLVTVTNSFVTHDRAAIIWARNATAAIGLMAAVVLGAIQPSYFISAASAAVGAVAALSLLIGRRQAAGSA